MNKSSITILLFIGVVIFINLVATQYYMRFDLTEDSQYTLSKATKDILKSLESPVTVRAYFSGNLPANIEQTKRNFEEYLIDYSRISGGNLVYKFINPSEDEKAEKDAQQAGISSVMINVREKDQMKQQKAYMGAILELDDQKEIIPFIQPGSAIEYTLSTAIKKISISEKPKIGFAKGNGETDIEKLNQVKSTLDILYDVEEVELNDSTKLDTSYKALAIVSPTDSISNKTFEILDNYLKKGGNLFIAHNKVKGDLQKTMQGTAINTGLSDWLSKKGVILNSDFVVDAKCATVNVQQQQGMFTFNTQTAFPYFPIIDQFSNHTATKGLKALVMNFASTITYNGNPSDSTKVFTPVAFSSDRSAALNTPLYFDIRKKWKNEDFPSQSLTVAAVYEETQSDNVKSKIFLVGDGDFPANENPQRKLDPNNVNLMVNGIDWLSDDTGLIDLRTKGIVYHPLDKLEDGTRTLLKYTNFFLPIILIILYGLFRVQTNKNRRLRRMAENFE